LLLLEFPHLCNNDNNEQGLPELRSCKVRTQNISIWFFLSIAVKRFWQEIRTSEIETKPPKKEKRKKKGEKNADKIAKNNSVRFLIITTIAAKLHICEEEHSEANRRARTREESEAEASSALLERKREKGFSTRRRQCIRPADGERESNGR